MKLTVLGKYGPYPPSGGATSGYLIKSKTQNALIDCGSGTLSRLTGQIDLKDLSFIIFSHLHFDHVSDFGVLSYALSFCGRKGKVNVYLPNFESAVYTALSKIDKFNLINVCEGKVYSEGDLSFSFYKMTHPVLSYGVKITDGNSTFSYTGDTTFNDNYIEVDYDLSNVMFITTANSLNMPRPLKDRMEIIHLSGYTEDEKLQIAKRHLIKKQFELTGITNKELKISDEAIIQLIRCYTRESGVRNLEREISKIARKALKEIQLENIKSITVTPKNLKKYSGVE